MSPGVLELVGMFFVVGGIAMLLEGKLGDIHRQNWEFYAINAALFVVFAYPGFVYRYLWRRRGGQGWVCVNSRLDPEVVLL